MRIEYIADDGTRFDNSYDCEDYEFKLHLPKDVNDIVFYDKHNLPISEEGDIFSEQFYSKVYRIYVPTDAAVTALAKIAAYTGFCCYGDVYSPGYWNFNEEKETFIKG